MAKSFKTLTDKMSPERRARIDARAARMLPPEPPMSARQHIARGLGIVFFFPIAYAVQILTPTPGPDWLYSYAKVFEWIAGPKGFRW